MMPRKRQPPVTDRVRTIAELAIRLDMSPRMVGTYRSLGMPGTPGNFSVEECCDWLVQHRKTVIAREEIRRRDLMADARQRRIEQQQARRRRHEEFMRQHSPRGTR
jgi:hypothetical protein